MAVRNQHRVRETKMFKFDKSDLQRVAASAVCALVLSTTMVVSAVGPARAIEMSPVAVQGMQGTGGASA